MKSESSVKRPRGAQPGNQNARKHKPYYTSEDATLIKWAQNVASTSLETEIAVIRVKLKSILRDQPDNIELVLIAMNSLVKLLNVKKRVDRLHIEDVSSQPA